MKIIVELNHPKHYYQFKYVMQILKENNHILKVVARNKDILLKLLEEEKIDYEIFGTHKKTLIGKVFATILVLFSYYQIFNQFKPDVVISKASFYSTFIARIKGIKSIIFPDSEVVKITNKVVAPLATKVVTPETFELNYGNKHVKVPGLFENCYLHPSILHIPEQFEKTAGLIAPYAVVRFIGWTANHDVGNSGFSLEEKISIVKKIAEKYTVYISSENELPSELAEYELKTPKSAIHKVLYGASLYVGDSQTMATEAALLGTPAIRSNSFVGPNDMSNFRILEHKYGMLRNVQKDANILAVIEELSNQGSKALWLQKRNNYFETVGNTNQIIASIILNT